MRSSEKPGIFPQVTWSLSAFLKPPPILGCPEIYYETLEMVTGSTYHPLQKSVENRGKQQKHVL